MDRDAVRAYYESFGEREWERLERPADGALEWEVHRRALEAQLPPSGRVLDIGGGPGRYSIWLAERGYQAVLADVSPRLLDIARRKAAEAGASLEAVVEADAADLSRWADASFDAVLCLGPFYHLPVAAERARAAAELLRVLKPGGPAFIALISRYLFLRRAIVFPDERHHLTDPDFLRKLMGEGRFDNDSPGRLNQGFGTTIEEIRPFFEGAGFETMALLASEGMAAGLAQSLDVLAGEDRPAFEAAVQLIADSAGDPSLLGASNHILYVGRRRG